jgi:hypothetical protein
LQYINGFNYIFTVIDRTSKWMEAIPLSEISAVACAKALTFSWISHFGVPETITSDHGLQFTSTLWFQLCEMFNISHRQISAYHPESNAAVERLHRRLKDALCPGNLDRGVTLCAPRPMHTAEEDTGLSPAEAVFGAPIVLPNEFLQDNKISVDSIIKYFSKTLDAPALVTTRYFYALKIYGAILPQNKQILCCYFTSKHY